MQLGFLREPCARACLTPPSTLRPALCVGRCLVRGPTACTGCREGHRDLPVLGAHLSPLDTNFPVPALGSRHLLSQWGLRLSWMQDLPGITWYLAFCDRLVALKVMSSGSMHAVARPRTSDSSGLSRVLLHGPGGPQLVCGDAAVSEGMPVSLRDSAFPSIG